MSQYKSDELISSGSVYVSAVSESEELSPVSDGGAISANPYEDVEDVEEDRSIAPTPVPGLMAPFTTSE